MTFGSLPHRTPPTGLHGGTGSDPVESVFGSHPAQKA